MRWLLNDAIEAAMWFVIGAVFACFFDVKVTRRQWWRR